ncbi:hypothetical protein FI667_g4242, partial [Globisporangium splendens]
MRDLLIKHESRENVPKIKLENSIKNALDAQWERLQFGKVIDKPGIPYYMSRLDSMQYERLLIKIDGKVREPRLFAKYGARNVETGPIQFLKSKLLRSIRPFNPALPLLNIAVRELCFAVELDAEVRVGFVENSKRVSITSCAAEVLKRKSTILAAGTDEFTPFWCKKKQAFELVTAVGARTSCVGANMRMRVLYALLALVLSAVAAPLTANALTIPWEEYLEVLGYYTGLGSQDRALDSVVAAIEAWEFSSFDGARAADRRTRTDLRWCSRLLDQRRESGGVGSIGVSVIFVLVSDIGVVEMERVMIQYEAREDVPMTTLEKVVKTALDGQWKRLNFGKMINQASQLISRASSVVGGHQHLISCSFVSQVIPFLPFEQEHIAQIIALKLSQLDENYRGVYWHRLWIEDGIADYMSRLDSMHYEVRSAKVDGKVTSSKIFAKYGARNVETDAEVRISRDAKTKEISITSCAPEDIAAKPKARQDGSEDANGDFVSIACMVRWKGKFV